VVLFTTSPGAGTVLSNCEAPNDQIRHHRTPQLSRQVVDRLWATGYLTLRDVACEVRDGIAYLDGRLRSHYLKQIAQATAAEVDGVRAVDNRIKVIR
jgi:osmotically-inducible protein OsmY